MIFMVGKVAALRIDAPKSNSPHKSDLLFNARKAEPVVGRNTYRFRLSRKFKKARQPQSSAKIYRSERTNIKFE
jgi:hypothetical protein